MSANFATFQERCSLRLISSYEMNHTPFLCLVLKSIQTMFTLVMVMGHTGIKRKHTGTFCYSDDGDWTRLEVCISRPGWRKKVWDETQPTRVGFAQGGMSCFDTLDVLTVTKWMKAIPVPGDQAIRVWAPHHIARRDIRFLKCGVGESLLITQSIGFSPLLK